MRPETGFYVDDKMKKRVPALVLLAAAALTPAFADDNEISLLSGSGEAVAYVAVKEDMTIYLWDGKPVAYLKEDSSRGDYHVYGFNGKHLGWFLKGAIWDHDGDASCGTKNVLRSTQYEGYKGYKEYKPYRSYAEYPPYRPYLSSSFGRRSCVRLLASGADD